MRGFCSGVPVCYIVWASVSVEAGVHNTLLPRPQETLKYTYRKYVYVSCGILGILVATAPSRVTHYMEKTQS